MIRWELCQTIDKEIWNQRIQSLPAGTIYQTTYWGDYLLTGLSYKPWYLLAYDQQGRVVASLLAYVFGLGQEVLRQKPLRRFSVLMAQRFFSILRWDHGPLIFDDLFSAEILDALWLKMDELCRVNHVYQIRHATGPIHCSLQSPSVRQPGDGDFEVEVWATYMVDLRRSVDELWAGLEGGRVRTPIKKVLKQNITVTPIETRPQLAEYHGILREARTRLHLPLPPAYPDEALWAKFYPKDCLRIMAGWQDGRMLAAVPVLIFNGILFLIAPAQSNYAYENKIDVNDLLHWEIIKWGSENDQRFYDLAGVSPQPRDAKEEGIRKYKRKFGGVYVEYPRLSKTYGRWRASMVNRLREFYHAV